MFAEVYPLTRLPRRFAFFDYQIPDEMTVTVGDVVNITLRKREILGIVRSIKKTSSFEKVAPIQSVASPFFSKEDMQRLEIIADNLLQAPASVFASALQNIDMIAEERDFLSEKHAQGSILKQEAQRIVEAIKRSEHAPVSLQASFEGTCALMTLIQEHTDGQLLVISPRERDTDLIAQHITHSPTATLSGKTKKKDRTSIAHAWRKGTLRTLVGTRQASLLPAKNLSAVIIHDAGSDDYEKRDRNPRIDPRAAARLIARQHKANLIICGAMPRLEHVHEPDVQTIFAPKAPVKVVSLKRKEEFSGLPLLSETLLSSIEETLDQQKRCLLVYNKKGVAHELICKSCGNIPLCGNCGGVPIVRKDDLICSGCKTEMWPPTSCPTCGSKKLKESGVGNERLVTVLQKRFPEASMKLIDKEHPQEVQTDIVIVTEFYFKNVWKPFSNKSFGLVANLAPDLGLMDVDFRALEHSAYRLHRLSHIAAQQQAKAITQTWTEETATFLEAKTFIQKELINRQNYQLPPFSPLITVLDKKQKKTYKKVSETLKNLPDSAIINVDTYTYEDVSSRKKSK